MASCSAGMAGANVWLVPLIAMVAERRRLSCLMTLRTGSPVRACRSRETANAVKTMVRWASIASRVRANMGRARRSDLVIRKDCSTCHRVVVGADHLGRWHEGGGDVGHVALEADELSGAVECRFIQGC